MCTRGFWASASECPRLNRDATDSPDLPEFAKTLSSKADKAKHVTLSSTLTLPLPLPELGERSRPPCLTCTIWGFPSVTRRRPPRVPQGPAACAPAAVLAQGVGTRA